MLKMYVWKGMEDPAGNVRGVAIVAETAREAFDKAVATLDDHTDDEKSGRLARRFMMDNYPEIPRPAVVWF